MLRHLIQKHEATHESARGKVTKPKIERMSEMACLMLGITQDILEAHQFLPLEHIQNTFIDSFINNDPNVIMALESAINDQDKNFDVMSSSLLLAERKNALTHTCCQGGKLGAKKNMIPAR